MEGIGGQQTTLSEDTWYTQTPRDLNSDIDAQFGVSTYTVDDVEFVDLEDAISADYPYPNMDAYFADLSITEGGPEASTPEAPLAVLLLILGIGVGGLVVVRRRRV